ncbi:MAG: DUF2267 domain-containing protein [Planctomycetota bacterium]
MPALDLPIITRDLQKLDTWLGELRSALETDDAGAYHVLRGVLHVVRDRLTVDEATDLGAQLPSMMRGIYYESWAPARTPTTERKEAQFFGKLAAATGRAGVAGAQADFAAVIATLQRHLDPGVLRHVHDMLPAEVQAHWPSA